MPRTSGIRHARWVPIGLALMMGTGCGLLFGVKAESDDDDDEQSWDTGTDGIPGGDGNIGAGDGLSPVITEGYAGYYDAGRLGITGSFVVTVEDPNDDIVGGIFSVTLRDAGEYEYVIGGDDVRYNEETGTVSLIFSNVDPVPYTVDLQVSDAAGHTSNVWTGVMAF